MVEWNFMGFMVVEWDLSWDFDGIYPLVNVYTTMENHHAINGKTLSISTGPFSIAM